MIGTNSLGQFALGQSQSAQLAINASLLTNTSTFYLLDLGKQYVVLPLLSNTSQFYRRVLWASRRKQAETWIERSQDNETWTRR